MEPNLGEKLKELEQKVDKIFISVEKTRKYFLWTMIITVVAFVVPLIGLSFAIPSFIHSYTSQVQSLSQ
jgi:hypothetical protein